MISNSVDVSAVVFTFSVFFLCHQELEDLDRWSFNIFRVAEFSNNRPLSCIMYAIFQVNNPSVNVWSALFSAGAAGVFAHEYDVLLIDCE